jgi:hypothetical protein
MAIKKALSRALPTQEAQALRDAILKYGLEQVQALVKVGLVAVLRAAVGLPVYSHTIVAIFYALREIEAGALEPRGTELSP